MLTYMYFTALPEIDENEGDDQEAPLGFNHTIVVNEIIEMFENE